MTDDILGIDLGTTNSEVAFYSGGRPEVLSDESGRIILPSVVGLSETGELLVGEAARNQPLGQLQVVARLAGRIARQALVLPPGPGAAADRAHRATLRAGRRDDAWCRSRLAPPAPLAC